MPTWVMRKRKPHLVIDVADFEGVLIQLTKLQDDLSTVQDQTPSNGVLPMIEPGYPMKGGS